jgi:cell division protein FtsI (penicillin-binding protein 3)
MPDLRGMGLRDAVYLAEQMNMAVVVKGKGKVKIQSVLPGSGINKKQKLILELN